MAKERVKCDRCGLEYEKGAPHMAFCRGDVPEGSTCVECDDDDQDFLSECFYCGEVVCDVCKEDAHVC